MIETSRLKIYAASEEQMRDFIASQTCETLKIAYTEMLNGSKANPDKWEWYAIWMIELKDGAHIGELCFKGLSQEGVAEIGYGILDDHQGHGYATEAISALVEWALHQHGVICIKAEIEEHNIASERVLEKTRFSKTGEKGEEGPIFVRLKTV